MPSADNPIWVRTHINVSTPFSLQLNAAATWLARNLYEGAASDPAIPAYPIAPPTVTGGTVVMDWRIRRSTTPGELAQLLERQHPAVAYEVTRVEELMRTDLQTSANAPAAREAAALESEESARPERVTIGSAVRTVADVAIFARGLLMAGIVAALLIVGWPFLRAASASGAALVRGRSRRRRRKGR